MDQLFEILPYILIGTLILIGALYYIMTKLFIPEIDCAVYSSDKSTMCSYKQDRKCTYPQCTFLEDHIAKRQQERLVVQTIIENNKEERF